MQLNEPTMFRRLRVCVSPYDSRKTMDTAFTNPSVQYQAFAPKYTLR